jgi:hypothetical protein
MSGWSPLLAFDINIVRLSGSVIRECLLFTQLFKYSYFASYIVVYFKCVYAAELQNCYTFPLQGPKS